jgi:hypothetical protein
MSSARTEEQPISLIIRTTIQRLYVAAVSNPPDVSTLRSVFREYRSPSETKDASPASLQAIISLMQEVKSPLKVIRIQGPTLLGQSFDKQDHSVEANQYGVTVSHASGSFSLNLICRHTNNCLNKPDARAPRCFIHSIF